MQVILLEKVANLGNLGDVVKDHAETTPSVMMKAVDREESRRAPQEASA